MNMVSRTVQSMPVVERLPQMLVDGTPNGKALTERDKGRT